MDEETNKKIDIENVKYPVVHRALKKFQWTQTKGDKNALIVWWDGLIPKEEFYSFLPHQKINKIPGMNILCLKCNFFQALNHMKILFDQFFNFYPTTFILPIQYPEFQNEHLKLTGKNNRTVTWILKPKSGCGGNGIRLVQNIFDLASLSQQAVIQRYVEPFLLGGYKFDFRLYVLITNLSPFTVYIYNEGLTRFCSHMYTKPNQLNIDDKYSHLTNTAVNVENQNNNNNILQLFSLVLSQICRIDQRGENIWDKIKNVVMLTLVAVYPEILKSVADHNTDRPIKYKYFRATDSPGPPLDSLHKYFHLLGIDIMLNRKLDPIVLELNDRPSLCVTFNIESEMKSKLVLDTLNLVSSNEKEIGGYEKILPVDSNSPISTAVKNMIAKSTKTVSKRFSPFSFHGASSSRRLVPKSKQRTMVLPPLYKSTI
ncbi:Tubulin-tyrosine ligase family protein [Tritrichomonas foetus]|uniref:Tubulin-tyrosine ligase family protein n=1 Tax=Tritrichomonas foetus TaxID=1144522 RepID=A0A1J4JCU5_9EUKA|nr:Tubulin-tyrosine ligase family protein [Tritrichomonas foetus]|eukprot:OHS95229.1 Tubulin-tyrosine ligase family protein [Tritrichomonas foetus]